MANIIVVSEDGSFCEVAANVIPGTGETFSTLHGVITFPDDDYSVTRPGDGVAIVD